MTRKILLVDDSAVNREYLSSILLKNNFEVIEAKSGGEAIETLVSSVPDVMILDLMMPGITGLDTLKRIRAKNFTFPIIIFTSDYKEETKRICLEAGANEFLYKPAKPYHLLGLINKLISVAATAH